MKTVDDVKHWIRGRFILESYRVATRRLGILLSDNWAWGEPSGWKLAVSVGHRRLVLRRF